MIYLIDKSQGKYAVKYGVSATTIEIALDVRTGHGMTADSPIAVLSIQTTHRTAAARFAFSVLVCLILNFCQCSA